MKRALPFLLPALLSAGAVSAGQANQNPALDLYLAEIASLKPLGRTGVFPDGLNGVAFATTACNAGTEEIKWQGAMDPDHPFISFLVARELDGRMEQISNRSNVKHGFFALAEEFCGDCISSGGFSMLGLGCSDTYFAGTNGDHYWLGPPDEIDPWLGLWEPDCSVFDRGIPAASPPQDCDGVRSFTSQQASTLGPVGHRIHVKDADLNVPGASFYFQGMYVLEKESEVRRGNNIASRPFTPSWTGSAWLLPEGGTLQHGSILSRWSGASLDSATNGGDDGRLYVAVKVSGPVAGFYHYEYAVHNRDNRRGAGALRIPLCPGARVRAAGFGDVDDDAGNDWSATVGVGELLFSTAANPVRWNSFFNFWFDSDAAPASSSVVLDQFEAGTGLASVTVGSSAPLVLYNVHLGSGCALDTPPTLYATGTPPQATLGNGSFAIESAGNEHLQPNFLRFGLLPGSQPIQGCTLWLGGTLANTFTTSIALTDGTGVAAHPAAVPNDLAFEGLEIRLQAIGRVPGNGSLFQNFELSEGLLVRVGNSLPSCP